jgi:ribonuclease HI
MQINIYTDGGARGNPGISGYGLVIYDENNKIIYQESKFLGIKTNNEAEYMGMIGALVWINDNKNNSNISQINFHSDSQLLVRQILGQYKVKAPNLKPLFDKVKLLLNQINLPYSFKDIRREFNKLADELANEAMDKKGL